MTLEETLKLIERVKELTNDAGKRELEVLSGCVVLLFAIVDDTAKAVPMLDTPAVPKAAVSPKSVLSYVKKRKPVKPRGR